MNLEKSLNEYIQEPKNQINNFRVGKQYEELEQLSAACSFYLRSAEFGEDKLLIYESLIRLFLCLVHQGERTYVSKGILLRAISFMPERPEAIFLLCRLYEQCKEWHESYAWARIGEQLTGITYDDDKIKGLEINNNIGTYGSFDHLLLITDVEYVGNYVFVFERAIAAWWIGLQEESIKIFKMLDKYQDINILYKNAVKNNLQRLS
jgi:hypothetical protein